MNIKDQVVSLELAKELKDLGVQQDSYFWWIQYCTSDGCKSEWKIEQLYCPWSGSLETYAVPTVAELGEMLPGEISEKIGNMTANPYFLDCGKIDSEHSYYVRYIRHATGDTFCIMRRSKEADARAKMLIYLIKEGIVKAKDKK
jgi:hypothetical protein